MKEKAVLCASDVLDKVEVLDGAVRQTQGRLENERVSGIDDCARRHGARAQVLGQLWVASATALASTARPRVAGEGQEGGGAEVGTQRGRFVAAEDGIKVHHNVCIREDDDGRRVCGLRRCDVVVDVADQVAKGWLLWEVCDVWCGATQVEEHCLLAEDGGGDGAIC